MYEHKSQSILAGTKRIPSRFLAFLLVKIKTELFQMFQLVAELHGSGARDEKNYKYTHMHCTWPLKWLSLLFFIPFSKIKLNCIANEIEIIKIWFTPNWIENKSEREKETKTVTIIIINIRKLLFCNAIECGQNDVVCTHRKQAFDPYYSISNNIRSHTIRW